jgi:FkbM family methyltransferase
MSEEDKKKKEEDLDKLFDDLFKNTDDKAAEKNKDNEEIDDDFIKSLFSEEPKEKNQNNHKPPIAEEKKEEKKDDDNFDWLKDLIDEIDKEEQEKKKQEIAPIVPAKPVKPSFTSKLKDKPRAPKPPAHIAMWGSGKKIVHMPSNKEELNNKKNKGSHKFIKYLAITISLMFVSGTLSFFLSNYMSCSTKTDICKHTDIILHKAYTGDKVLIDTSLVSENGKRIVEQGYIDAHISNLMYNLVKKGSKVIDVGSGFGYYTFYLARIVGSNGKVYSIEGRKNVFELLDASVRINRFSNIETFNAVLFSDIMKVTINLDDNKRQSNFGVNNIILQKENVYTNSESVTTVTLDAMLNGITNISMININANGNELSIILGAKNIIANSPNIKIITTWSKYEMGKYVNIQNVVQQLINNGFKFWLIKPSSGKLVELSKTEDILQIEKGRFLIAKNIE